MVLIEAAITWPLTLGLFVTEKSLNNAKGNYSFHWKLEGNRALILNGLDSMMTISDFGHVQEVNWVKVDPKTQNLGKSCHCKNSSSSKCFKWHLYNYEDYLWNLGFSNIFGFLAGIKLGPKMDQKCKLRCVPFEPNFKILKDFSNTVFVLLKTTSGQSFSKIKQYLGE